MKLVTFECAQMERAGLWVEGEVIDLHSANPALPADMLSLLAGGDAALAAVRRAAAISPRLPLSQVRLLSPVPRPGKIVCVGQNYWDHCREQNVDPPTHPILFAKFNNAVVAPGDPIRLPALSQQVDYEAELGIVIGKLCRQVSEAQALEHVAGYTCVNDVSARDIQFGDKQWTRGKSFDTFCPIGPAIVTRDEIADPQHLPIRCTVSGEQLQDSSTSLMIFSCAFLISFISQSITLEPGDLISTGTPNGVGIFRKPPRLLRAGDTVTVSIDGVGELTNPVVGA